MQVAEDVVPQNTRGPLQGPVVVRVSFVCHRPRTTKRSYPRGDGDNFEKAVYDVITKKGYWEDDDQIVKACWEKRFVCPEEAPRVDIEIGEYEA